MRTLLQTILTVFVLATAAPALAQEDRRPEIGERLEIGMSTDEIAIASDFRGADLTIFGAIDMSFEIELKR